MKLWGSEGHVLAGAQLQANKPVVELARSLKLKPHIVRDALARLERREVFQRVSLIDATRIGYQQHHVLFSIAAGKVGTTDNILKRLRATSGVSFIAELGGSYQYELILLARSMHEVVKIFDQLSLEHPTFAERKVISSCLAFHLFQKKYLGAKTPPHSQLLAEQVITTPIDELDQEILRKIGIRHCISVNELARVMQRPVATVHSRIKELERSHIIRGHILDIEPRTYGFAEFKILLSLKDFSQQLRQSLVVFAARHPNITTCIETFGAWDIELIAEFPDARAVLPLHQELLAKFGDAIHAVDVMERFSALHFNMYPF